MFIVEKKIKINLRYVSIFLFSIIILISYLGSKSQTGQNSLRYKRIDPINVSIPNESKGIDVFGSPVIAKTALIDGSIRTYLEFSSDSTKPKIIEYDFKKEETISRVNINFLDRNPKKIQLAVKDNDKWVKIASVDNFSSATLEKLFSKKDLSNTTALQISISSVKTIEVIKISELYIQQQEPQNIIEHFHINLFLPRGFWGSVLITIFVLLFIIAAGITISTILLKKLSEEINPLTIVGMGLIVIASFGVIECLLPLNLRGIPTILAILFSTIYLLFQNNINIKIESIILILISLIFVLQAGIFNYYKDQSYQQLMSDYDSQFDNTDSVHYPYGAFEMDYILPFSITKVLYYQIPADSLLKPSLLSDYKLFDRTPLFSLFSMPFLILFGDRFFIFQNVSVAISGLFLVSSYLLVKQLFNKKIAILSCVFLTLNPYLLFASHFFQIKLLLVFMTCYLLHSTYTEIKTGKKFNLWISSLGSFLIHPFALIFIFMSAMVQFLSYKSGVAAKIKRLFRCYAPVGVAIFLWILVGFFTPGRNLFSALSLSTNWRASISVTGSSDKPKSPINTILDAIQIRLKNIEGLIVKDPFKGVTRPFGPIRTTLPGLLTYCVAATALIGIFLINKKQLYKTIAFSVIVILLTATYVGNYASWSLNEWLMGIVPLIAPVAAVFIIKIKPYMQLSFFLALCCEHIYSTWIKFGYEANIKVLDPIYKSYFPPVIFLPYVILLIMYILFLYRDSISLRSK